MQNLKSKEDPAVIAADAKQKESYYEAAIIRFRPENDPELQEDAGKDPRMASNGGGNS